jgi:hypothetical protein
VSARAHLAAVFGDQTGWVFIGIGTGQYVTDTGKVAHEHWAERSFRWPTQADEIIDEITHAVRAGGDVYFTPSLSENPVREKPGNPKHGRKARPVHCLWADLDNNYNLARLAQLRIRGGCWFVASGSEPGRWHLYVPLVEPAPPDIAEDLLRRLAAYLGADPAPAWHGGYLRPVGTKNWKPAVLTGETPGDVCFEVEPCEAVWTVDDLDDLLPSVDYTSPAGEVPDAEPVDMVPAELREVLDEKVTAGMDRSTRTMAAVGACVRAGLSDGQVITVMRGHAPTTEKYDGRADAEVARVLGKVRAQEPGSNGSTPAAEPCTLEQAHVVFQRWLYLPDPLIVTAALGAAAANILPGDPVWVLLVGPPGCGKTETLAPLTHLPYVYEAATVTPAALLSGTPPKEKAKNATGGLLRQIGGFGILLCKDFTSVLSMYRDARAEALAALREIHDGSWARPMGTAGGTVLHWSGKCGLLGGCTPTIDRHHAVMGTLGERFLLYRVDVADPTAQAKKRLAARRHGKQMRAELAEAAAGVLVPISADLAVTPPGPGEDDWLVKLAVFTAHARTPVERDGYDRTVVVMPASEGPARIAVQLGAMRDGLAAIGAESEVQHRILLKMAWDAMPAARRRVLEALRNSDWLTTSHVCDRTQIPRTTVERELEDLALIGLIRREKASAGETSSWHHMLSDAATSEWPEERPSASPEMSGGRGSG